MNDYSGIKNGFANLPIPGLSKLPLIGEGLFDHNLLVYLGLNGILWVLRVPAELCPLMKDYLLIIFLGNLFWFYYFVYLTTRRMSEAAELHAQNQLLSMENTRYRELREHMDATRQLRHDFRQHLHVIAGLSEAKKYDKLNDYLAEYEGRLASPHTMLCANAALDAIAGHYQRIAETQNTRISWRLDLPERLPLDEVDLCMMLGNLLENALRAVCALPVEEREVRVVSGMIGGAMLGLSVENGYVGEIAFAPNGLPTSHKKDHGVGLASVAATVKRHNGTLSVAAKDGVFSAHILLSL